MSLCTLKIARLPPSFKKYIVDAKYPDEAVHVDVNSTDTSVDAAPPQLSNFGRLGENGTTEMSIEEQIIPSKYNAAAYVLTAPTILELGNCGRGNSPQSYRNVFGGTLTVTTMLWLSGVRAIVLYVIEICMDYAINIAIILKMAIFITIFFAN